MDANTLGIVIGIAGIVIGVTASYYFYRKSLRTKEPCVTFRHNNLVQNYVSKFDGLEIFYKGKKIEDLTITKVLFWNNGSDTIHRQDIAAAEPIEISCEGNAELLDVKVIASNNDASELSCKLINDKNIASIDFDYLDKGQGGVIQVVHTGIKDGSLVVSGIIKGGRALQGKRLSFPETAPRFMANRIGYMIRLLLLSVAMIFVGAFATIAGSALLFNMLYDSGSLFQPPPPKFDSGGVWVGWFFTITLLLGGASAFMAILEKWYNRPPRGLEFP